MESLDWKSRRTLLLVDDEPSNLHVLKQILQDDYQLLFAKDGATALEICEKQQPDLVLLDVMMSVMSGYDVCMSLKQNSKTARIPVIFVSAMTETMNEAYGFEVGGVDYITKPLSPVIVKARVATHLSLVNTVELHETRLQIIQRLGRAAEYRDNETGLHVIRMSHYARLLALEVGFSEQTADVLFNAAPMHDIGKIGIPDHILLKPGKLDANEWEVMKKHAAIGAEIIGDDDSQLMQTARIIALTHHEKWNGSGYPNGLRGEAIPLVGRIVAVVDVFDALTTERPYKKAWSVESAIELIQRESGQHFDPQLVALFVELLPKMLEIKHCWAEVSNECEEVV